MARRFQIRLADHWIELTDGVTTIGRDAEATIALDDDLVSRRHAVIEISNGGAFLDDLGSRNGTFVNAVRVVDRVELRNSDRIGIGDHVLEFRVQGVGEGAGVVSSHPTVTGAKLPTLASISTEVLETQEMDVLAKYVRLERWREVENLLKTRVADVMAKTGLLSADHPKTLSILTALIALAEHHMSPAWLDRLFRLCQSQGWLLPIPLLDRAYRVIRAQGETGGEGLAEYVSYWSEGRRFAALKADDQSRIRILRELVDMYQRKG